MSRHFSSATLTPELLADIHAFHLTEDILKHIHLRLFRVFSVLLTSTIAYLVGLILPNLFSLAHSGLFLKDFPESIEISARCLSEYDEVIVSFFNGFPLDSVVVFATLNLSRGAYRPVDPGWSKLRPLKCSEIISWRAHAIIFGLAFDPIALPSYSDSTTLMSLFAKNLWRIEARFFKDVSRSGDYAVDDVAHNTIAGQCLSFLLNQIFPLPLQLFHRGPRMKIRPWLTRRRAKAFGTSIPRTSPVLEWTGTFSSNREPSGGIQLLISLRLALSYLPPLLCSATHSPELVIMAKCWWRLSYVQQLFPNTAKVATKAIKRYLLRCDNR